MTVSALRLPPLGEAWDGGAEMARKTPVDASLAILKVELIRTMRLCGVRATLDANASRVF